MLFIYNLNQHKKTKSILSHKDFDNIHWKKERWTSINQQITPKFWDQPFDSIVYNVILSRTQVKKNGALFLLGTSFGSHYLNFKLSCGIFFFPATNQHQIKVLSLSEAKPGDPRLIEESSGDAEKRPWVIPR